MLGDALDALKKSHRLHAAIPVGRHGSLLHEDEDCGSRRYASRQRLTCSPTGRGARLFSERPHARPSRTDGPRTVRESPLARPVPSPYPLFSTAPGPKQEDCEFGAGLRQPHPARSAQNRTKRSRSASSASLPPSKGASPEPSEQRRHRAPCGQRGGCLAMLHPQICSSLRNSWKETPRAAPSAAWIVAGCMAAAAAVRLGRSPRRSPLAAPGGPHQPREALWCSPSGMKLRTNKKSPRLPCRAP